MSSLRSDAAAVTEGRAGAAAWPVGGGAGPALVDLALEATVALSFSRVGYEVRRRVWSWSEPPEGGMDGRVAVVTGATSGLGRTLATRFAALGASVVVVGRDVTRTAEARDAIADLTGAGRVTSAHCDLARLDDVRTLAVELRRDHDRLDVLVHNAGALAHEFERTVDGLELTVQTHVVAPYLLTTELLGLLKATPDARVLTVASGGMYTAALGHLDIDPEGFDGVRTYARAKRAQVVLNGEWARRHPEVASFQAMHPGWVDTPGLRASLPRFARAVGPLLRTPDEGVDTLLWLATASLPGNGGFWLDRRRRWTNKVPWTRTSAGEADDLWRWAGRRSGTAEVGSGAGPVLFSTKSRPASSEGMR